MKRHLDMLAIERVFDAELSAHGKRAALHAVVAFALHGRPVSALPDIERVAAAFKLKSTQLLGRSKDRYVVQARWVAMRVMSESQRTTRDIGAVFNVASSNVVRGLRRLEVAMAEDRMLARLVGELLAKRGKAAAAG